MARRRDSVSVTAGLPPGTPVHVGRATGEAVKLEVFDYSLDELNEGEVGSVEECAVFKGKPTVTWVNVTGVHDIDLLQNLGEKFGLHPLVVEDIANTAQRPKADDYESYVFTTVKMLLPGAESPETQHEQVSLILGRGFVISFQERVGDVFEPVRTRIRQSNGRIRRMGADYLFYCLLDAVVDGYFAVCEEVSDKVEPLQDKLLGQAVPSTLQAVHALKHEVASLRRAVWPLRDVVSAVQRLEGELITDETRLYLRDVYDHTVQVIDALETYRDTVGGMADLYLSSVSNRMNEVMKVLTIIATIFIPLSFIAGVYGMNFDKMPELHWAFGYPAALLAMATVAGGMLLYFWRHGWL